MVRFGKTAQYLFAKGAPETKCEVIEILSSNIGIKDRKIASFSLNEPFIWLREDVKNIEAEICTFEPKKETIDGVDKTKTEAGASVCSILLGLLDAFGTVDWRKIAEELRILSQSVPRLAVLRA